MRTFTEHSAVKSCAWCSNTWGLHIAPCPSDLHFLSHIKYTCINRLFLTLCCCLWVGPASNLHVIIEYIKIRNMIGHARALQFCTLRRESTPAQVLSARVWHSLKIRAIKPQPETWHTLISSCLHNLDISCEFAISFLKSTATLSRPHKFCRNTPGPTCSIIFASMSYIDLQWLSRDNLSLLMMLKCQP